MKTIVIACGFRFDEFFTMSDKIAGSCRPVKRSMRNTASLAALLTAGLCLTGCMSASVGGNSGTARPLATQSIVPVPEAAGEEGDPAPAAADFCATASHPKPLTCPD